MDESEGWRGTRATTLAYALIVLAYGILIARLIWSPRGAMEFLLGLVFVVVGFDAVLEILAAFIWAHGVGGFEGPSWRPRRCCTRCCRCNLAAGR